MKKTLCAIVIALIAGTAISNAQNSWFLSTTFNTEVQANIDTKIRVWTVGVGVGMHKMLNDKFSLGINLSYANTGSSASWDWLSGRVSASDNLLMVGIDLASYIRLADKLYYVPELEAGAAFLFGEGVGFAAGLSPLGLEFRPGAEKVGIRFNIINLSYTRMSGNNSLVFVVRPTLSVNFRF